MTTQTFTWRCDEGASEDTKPDIASTKFGDGYEQRVLRGINPDIISWTVKFSGDVATIAPIRAFLLARNGVEAFLWANPFNETNTYVCKQWVALKSSASIVEISAKFERVYEAVV